MNVNPKVKLYGELAAATAVFAMAYHYIMNPKGEWYEIIPPGIIMAGIAIFASGAAAVAVLYLKEKDEERERRRRYGPDP